MHCSALHWSGNILLTLSCLTCNAISAARLVPFVSMPCNPIDFSIVTDPERQAGLSTCVLVLKENTAATRPTATPDS
jgi:hypothetical protein